MATRLTHKNRVTTCGVLSWEPRPWDEAELSAMQSISSLLHQSLDAIEMSRAVSVADEMERLTTRVSAALTHQTSLPDALDQVLADIARTIGGSGAAWVEFTPNAHRYDLLGGIGSTERRTRSGARDSTTPPGRRCTTSTGRLASIPPKTRRWTR